jgi:acyl carrier protein
MKIGKLFEEINGSPAPPLAADCALSGIEGWDSLTMVRLMVRLEQHLGRELAEAELGSLTTVGDVQRLLEK